MLKHIFTVMCFLLMHNGLLESKKYNHILPNGGQIWAFLVAGSNGYDNYRHQADVCHAYQILHKNGIPDSNIIVMMYDDIANAPDNPTPGIIINKPNGPNVYAGVPKDYVGKDVNIKNFLNVLSGNKTGMHGIGSGRVIESGPNDHIFVNFVDHGGEGVLCFPEEELKAVDLINALENMAANKLFEKMIMYVEACYSGSMFDNKLPDDINIFITTAADPRESSYAIFWDEAKQVFLGDVFSVMWMDDTEHEALAAESLHHQFQRVRTTTNTSHVEEYGDLDMGNTKLGEIIGEKSQSFGLLHTEGRIQIMDAVPNNHVPVAVLTKKLASAKTPEERHSYSLQLKQLLQNRKSIDKMVFQIVQRSVTNPNDLKKVLSSKSKLTKDNMKCHKNLVSYFSETCYSIAKNPYSLMHLGKFINLCTLPGFNENTAISSMQDLCKHIGTRMIGIV